MGRVQDEFTTALKALMRDAGWMPTFFEGAGRRAYFGSDRSREWASRICGPSFAPSGALRP